ncbi:hypothetical protein TNIN_312891 [Trichonephila inaurata madagascariensis]|uniref:Uncharacterized protein n=1 Tax=Trichonephila inaurata madagascariensis TaxID=2747483 RepID=A0A8X6YRC6_9ARAC|nr:hypothetical protein TNIN_312891 [Trichonephila inaurata madagascariensis]
MATIRIGSFDPVGIEFIVLMHQSYRTKEIDASRSLLFGNSNIQCKCLWLMTDRIPVTPWQTVSNHRCVSLSPRLPRVRARPKDPVWCHAPRRGESRLRSGRRSHRCVFPLEFQQKWREHGGGAFRE